MSSEQQGVERAERLGRVIRRQRVAIAGLAGAMVLAAGLGQAGRGTERRSDRPQVATYAAGGDRVYRVWDTGAIEYLVVDFAQGTAEGIPGWAPVHIDHTLSRDRMGNIVRVRR